MKDTDRDGACMKWDVKDRRPSITVLLLNITKAQAGRFRQDTAVSAVLNQASGIP